MVLSFFIFGHSFYLFTFTFTESDSPSEKRKGEAAWKKSWAHGPVGLFTGKWSHISRALSVRHLTWWSWLTLQWLEDALLEAASAQDFIAGEPHYPT